MTTKNLVVLGGVAVALAVAAAFMGKGSASSPRLTGERIVPKFDMSLVSSVEIGDKVKLADSPDGWIVPSMQDYPADLVKIRENLLKLQDLKVGQVVRGRALKEKTPVVLRDSSGKELASVVLGDRHEKWGHGRYVQYKDQSVLVSDTLDDFGADSKRWVETKIVDEPYVSFRELADPKLTEEELRDGRRREGDDRGRHEPRRDRRQRRQGRQRALPQARQREVGLHSAVLLRREAPPQARAQGRAQGGGECRAQGGIRG